MREILFRGKKVGSDEWVYGNYQHTDCYELLNDFIGQNVINIPVKPETVCQFTGLIDIKGKKIFEGDMLKHYNQSSDPNEYVEGLVFFDNFHCCFIRTSTISASGYARLSADCR